MGKFFRHLFTILAAVFVIMIAVWAYFVYVLQIGTFTLGGVVISIPVPQNSAAGQQSAAAIQAADEFSATTVEMTGQHL